MVRVKRRALTLIEILVSMSLLTVIVLFLLSYYRGLTLQQAEIEQARLQVFRERYAFSRLKHVLNHAQADSLYTGERRGSFVEGETLTFSFDNGAVIDPELSGQVLAKLYWRPPQAGEDARYGTLSLAIWPRPPGELQGEPPSMRRETLLEDVQAVDFALYLPPVEEDGIMQAAELVTSLPLPDQEEARRRNPVAVVLRIQLAGETEPLRFAFPVADGLIAIEYPSTG